MSETIQVNGEQWVRYDWYCQRGQELTDTFDELLAARATISELREAVGVLADKVAFASPDTIAPPDDCCQCEECNAKRNRAAAVLANPTAKQAVEAARARSQK